MNYEIIDTVVATNKKKNESVRVNATIGDNQQPAFLYVGRNMRLTLFDPEQEDAQAVNQFMSDRFGDQHMLDTLNAFTNSYA